MNVLFSLCVFCPLLYTLVSPLLSPVSHSETVVFFCGLPPFLSPSAFLWGPSSKFCSQPHVLHKTRTVCPSLLWCLFMYTFLLSVSELLYLSPVFIGSSTSEHKGAFFSFPGDRVWSPIVDSNSHLQSRPLLCHKISSFFHFKCCYLEDSGNTVSAKWLAPAQEKRILLS